ncbi:MAG: TlpA disulfide reductase family protein [Candidatus Binatia bacterium]
MRTAASLLFLLGLSAQAFAQDAITPAPAIELPAEAGAPVALASLKGKVVLIDVWASWCVPCKAAFPAYDEMYRKYKDRGFEVLAVNVDEKRADAEKFLRDRKHVLKVVFDPKGEAPLKFKVRGMPTSFLVDKRGNIRFAHEGFTAKDIALYRRRIDALLAEAP